MAGPDDVGLATVRTRDPSIKTWKAQAFVPFFIEVGADWVGMESELRMAFGGAKDRLEASAFATGAGDGSSQPTGIVTALTGTAAVQASAGADADAVADVYAGDVWRPRRP